MPFTYMAALGLRVEELFGVPQDIEWAVADGVIWLLQSRPITNLPPPPLHDVRWAPPVGGTVWMRRQVVEHMPEPLSPFSPNCICRKAWRNQRHVPLLLRMYMGVLPALLRRGISSWRDQALPTYRQKIAYWKELDLAGASADELLRGVRELAVADAVYWFAAALPLGLARVTDAVLDSYLKSVASGRGSSAKSASRPTSGPYLRGFPSIALEAQKELEAIAGQIRRSETLREQVIAAPAARLLDHLAEDPQSQPVLDSLRRYMDRYGHQIYNLDFAVPTLADDPLPVYSSLVAALQKPQQNVGAHQRKLAQERESLVVRREQALNPVQRRIFRLLLSWAQRYTPYREEALFHMGAAWPALGRLALELGRRLTDAGSLYDPDDIFYLNSLELKAAIDSRAGGSGRPGLASLALERRNLREARKRLDPPLSVLVCPTTTPAWTPLFSQAVGLVTDIGGALAHGSIVAREYGIPAVMGTGVATQRIHSGQLVSVDGDAGAVTLVDEISETAEETQPVGAGLSPNRFKVILLLAAGVAMLVICWKKRRRSRSDSVR